MKYKYRQTFVVGHKPDGKPIRKEVRSNNKREFDAKVRYYRNLYAKGVQVVGKGFTVEQWAYLWLDRYKKSSVGPSQLKNYETLIRLHICPIIGHMDIKEVKPFHIQEVLDRSSTRSKSNMDKLMGTLRQMFERAEIDGMIEHSPARKMIRPMCEDVHRRRALTRSEIQSLLATASHHRAGLWVRLMLQCGARRGEATAVRVEDINREKRLLHICHSVEYASENKGRLKSTKTESGERYVPIPDDLFEDLIQYIRDRKLRSGFLFKNANGRNMSETKVRRLWSSFMRQWDLDAGAETYRNAIITHAIDQDITPHYLRHTYATQLYRTGIDLKTAQYLLGHADIRTTANIYSHIDADDVAGIASKTDFTEMWVPSK